MFASILWYKGVWLLKFILQHGTLGDVQLFYQTL